MNSGENPYFGRNSATTTASDGGDEDSNDHALTNDDPPAPAPAPDNNATSAPTAAPTNDGNDNDNNRHHMSLTRIIAKTVAWLILIGLSVVAFGACMSNRYRIYFFLRGCWYRLLRSNCAQFVLRKIGLGDTTAGASGGGGDVDTSLNAIIFDDALSEGLLTSTTG